MGEIMAFETETPSFVVKNLRRSTSDSNLSLLDKEKNELQNEKKSSHDDLEAGLSPSFSISFPKEKSKSKAVGNSFVRKNLTTSIDFSSDWKLLKASLSKGKNAAFENVSIKCDDLDSFYNTFWSKCATHPISEYQTNVICDEEICTSEWEQSIDASPPFLQRTINFLHPNHAAIGPRMARSMKKQKLQQYSKFGIMMNTTTHVKDVPKTDCFYLEDYILVEPDSKGDGVLVSAFMEIHFVQSTMWKKIIQKNAICGINVWLKGYSDFLKKCCCS